MNEGVSDFLLCYRLAVEFDAYETRCTGFGLQYPGKLTQFLGNGARTPFMGDPFHLPNRVTEPLGNLRANALGKFPDAR